MSHSPGIIQSIIGELGEFLIWIRDTIKDDAVRREVLIDMGLDPDSHPDSPLPEGSTDSIEQYRNAVNPDEEALNQALLDIRTLFNSIKEFLVAFAEDPFTTSNIDELVWQLFQVMGTNYMRLHYPKGYWLFQVLGFLGEFTEVRNAVVDGTTMVAQGGYRTFRFVFTNIWEFIKNPIEYVKNLPDRISDALKYSKNLDSPLDTREGAQAFSYIFLALAGYMAFLEYENKGEGKQNRYLYSWEPTPSNNGAEKTWADQISESAFSFDIQLSEGAVTEFLGGTMIVVSREDVPTDLPQPTEGVVIEPSGGLFVSLNGEINVETPISDNWELNATVSSGNILDVYLDRLADINIMGDGKLALGLTRRKDPETGASFALPDSTGSRLTIGNIFINTYLGPHDAGFEIALQDNAIVVSPEGADGFLKDILPRQEAQLTYSIAAGYSRKKKFYVNHSIDLLEDLLKRAETPPPASEETPKPSTDNKKKSSIESLFPIHKEMGIARFESIDWSYGGTKKKDSFGLNIGVRTTFSTKLGPLFLQVQKIGVGMDLSVPREGDDPSKTELDFGFLFPKGVGLRVDSEVVSGGGFLEFDRENHRYAGVLSLNFQSIELSAVGLINTLLPNNQEGYSVLVSISVLFKPAIQLSFGFKLEGVGGLVGVHRTIKVDELRTRIFKGAVNSIMFPKDVIKNAPKIISDLRGIFPPKYKHYVFAPFLKISWGTPSVVEADLGVLVELPFKGRLLLIGTLGIYHPDKKAPKRLVEIHVDVLGDFNFSAAYILIEGRLRKSKIADVSLSGGFAYMLDWGDRPQFLMSVGGYHPRYKKPDGFPKIPRLSALIKKGKDVVMTCQYYQAVTSNSYQIGLKADLLVKWKSVTVKGWLEFNALFQINPLLFEADIHIGAAIRYRSRNLAGVDFYFLLSGPEPWRAKGYAKIEILFFSLKVKFNHSWGGEQEVAPSTIEAGALLSQLTDQLEETRNWSGRLPDGFNNAASIRSLDTPEDAGLILAHPSGTLEVRQTVLPLDKTIEKMGNSFVNDQPSYRIASFEIGEGANAITVDAQQQTSLFEHFSRGQFEDLPDAKKISTPDFELMKAGVSFGSIEAHDFSDELDFKTSDFEDIILSGEERITPETKSLNWQEKNWINPAFKKKALNKNKPVEVFGLVEDLPLVEESKYKILSTDHLEEPADLGEHAFTTYSEAKEYMKTHLWAKRSNWQIQEVEEVF